MSGTSDTMKPSGNASPDLTKVTKPQISPAVKEHTQNRVSSNQHLSSLPAGLQTPVLIVNNCTFSSCSVAISGQEASEKFTDEQICQETLKDIDIDDIFD